LKDTTELERATLGALLNQPSHMEAVLGLVSGEDFTTLPRARIWRALESHHYAGTPIDVVTIGEATEALADCIDLASNAPAANNAPVYAKQLAEHARARRIAATIRSTLSSLEGGDYGSVDALPATIEMLQARRGGTDATFSEALSRSLELVEDARSAPRDRQIAFGLPALDERLPILAHRGVLVVVAARPSVGKTAISNQLTLTSAKRGLPIGKIELEMSIEEMALRSIAAEYHINGSALAAGDDLALQDLTERVQERNIRDLPIFLDDQSYSLPTIIARISEWHRKHGIVCVTVDHLGLIAHQGESRNTTLGEITRALKLLAKRLQMPIVLLSQLARLNEREHRKPKLSDMRDSGAIEQDADIVIALHSDSLDADQDGVRWVDVGLLKNRGGRTGWIPRSYAFDGRYQTFTEHPLRPTGGTQGGARAQGQGASSAYRGGGSRSAGGSGSGQGAYGRAPRVPESPRAPDWE